MSHAKLISKIRTALLDERGITNGTADGYIRKLILLFNNSERPFTSLAWLKHYDTHNTFLSQFTLGTQKNYATAITSILSLSIFAKSPLYRGIKKHWDKTLYTLTTSYHLAQPEIGVKTPKQSASWKSWDDITAIRDELKSKALALQDKKTLTPRQFDTLTQYMVLSLFTYIPPRRNADIQNLFITTEYSSDMPKDVNYLDVNTLNLIFNVYKTKDTYGQQVFNIADNNELLDAFRLFIIHHPLRDLDTFPLFQKDGKHITTVNFITRILNKIFGSNVGSSMLRHIYESNAFGGIISELKDTAHAMAHSPATAISQYIKTD